MGRTSSHRSTCIQSLERRCLLAADLVISEFLASNQTNIVDNFGDHSDWIELFNRGDAAANLNDYFLTDDAATPAKWRFPSQSLAAGAYLVVYASDRNIANAGQPLHTNFKISADGEYLGLMRTDGSAQYAYAPSFPAQTGNVSYGMTDESNPASALQYFGTPTPGAVNVASAAAATFSVAGKVFSGQVQVALSSTTPGAQIRYTTNRTEPTASSTLYTGPITLSSTTMLRTRVFASGYNASPVVGNSYVRVDTTTANFNTNLGLVIVDTHGAALNDTTYVLGSGAFIDNVGDGRAGTLDSPDYLGRIGIRIRGSSSQDFPKQQYAVELWDETSDDRSLPLMGLPADSDWILYAPYSEKSLLQNALAYDWARAAGQYAPRVKFIELYLNTSGTTNLSSSHYAGVYMLVEKIKISPDRVNITEISASDNTEPNITGGYLWKKDRYEPDETVLTTSSGQEMVLSDPETLSNPQRTWLLNYLNTFESVLNGSNFKDPVNGYAKYIDVDSWIDHWIMTEMGKQIDGFRLSTFYYKDRGGKIKMGPQWDYNLAFGNGHYNGGAHAAGWYSDYLGDFDYPYFRRLFQDPAFKQKLVDRWSQLRESTFSNSTLLGHIDAYVDELSNGNGNYPVGTYPTQISNNPVVRNFKKWNVLGTYFWPNGFYDLQGRWIEDVRMMKNWLTGRLAWMDSQLLPAPVPSVASGFQTGPIGVTLTPNRVVNSDVTLLGSTGPAYAIIPTSDLPGWNGISYSTTGWTAGTNGVGFDANTSGVDYNPLIGLNVGAMRNARTSVFARFPFTLADASSVQSLILKMKYDDGFVAYLNGHQIAFANAPGTEFYENVFVHSWNDAATAVRDDNLSISFVEWDVTAWKGLLVNGTNVLAIHGMNQSAGSSDLLVLPELVSRTRVAPGAADTQVWYTTDGSDPLLPDGVTRNPSAVLYTGAVGIGATTRLSSRSLRAGAWSGLRQSYYLFGSDALRVSELMYNPSLPAGSSFSAQDYEYVELQNTGTVALNLKDYAFVDGIDFTFPDTVLAPGAFALIVKNLAAFQSRYGTTTIPLGVYSGSLDNAGDTLELRDPFGAVAQLFTYDDAWYPSTDGDGASLEAIRPGMLDLNLAASWRASLNGTPGTADLVAPQVISSAYPYDIARNRVIVTFNDSVEASLDISDLVVVNSANSAVAVPVAVDYDPATHIAVFTFAPDAFPDGNYQATLIGEGVTDAAGNVMSNHTLDFFVLTGDVNRDRSVGFEDLLVLAQNYGLTGRTFSQGNIDYSSDGEVSFEDLLLLAQRYGTSMLKQAPGARSKNRGGSLRDELLR